MCASCFSGTDSFLLGSAGAVAVTTTRTGGRLARWAADDDAEVREPALAGV